MPRRLPVLLQDYHCFPDTCEISQLRYSVRLESKCVPPGKDWPRMGSDRSYLVLGAVMVIVFTIGMLITQPSLRPPITEMRYWLASESAMWTK